MRLVISSIYEANCSKSTISSITDAVMEDVKRFSEKILPSAFSPSSSTPPTFPLGGIRSRRRPSTWPSGRPTTARPWSSATRSRPWNRRSPIRSFCPASSQGAWKGRGRRRVRPSRDRRGDMRLMPERQAAKMFCAPIAERLLEGKGQR